MVEDVRWQQRFQNFDRALNLISSALKDHTIKQLSDLEQEGVIQRFEIHMNLHGKP